MGENTQRAMVAFSAHLAEEQTKTDAQRAAAYVKIKAVYFDVLGIFMVGQGHITCPKFCTFLHISELPMLRL